MLLLGGATRAASSGAWWRRRRPWRGRWASLSSPAWRRRRRSAPCSTRPASAYGRPPPALPRSRLGSASCPRALCPTVSGHLLQRRLRCVPLRRHGGDAAHGPPPRPHHLHALPGCGHPFCPRLWSRFPGETSAPHCSLLTAWGHAGASLLLPACRSPSASSLGRTTPPSSRASARTRQ